jgi:2-methylisocitrate lyase-like PEP mutase family enzyme
MVETALSHSKRLRKMLSDSDILVVPGAGSPLELRLIEQAGFEAAYVSGYATAGARYGLPDIGLIAYSEVAEMLRSARRVTTLPLIVDCDTGYGDVASVCRTVRDFEALGAAAVQIEDQQWPKRCGHMDGKLVEPEEVAVRKVEAAVAARHDDLVIVARTDARQPLGIEAALRRCRLFRDAGADIIFVDGPESREELAQIASAIDAPLIANMSESGKTPILSASELSALGFKIALFPSSTFRLCLRHVSDFLADLRATGDSRPWMDRMATLNQTNAALGLDAIWEFERLILARHLT